MKMHEYTHIEDARKHSEQRLDNLREALSGLKELEGCSDVVVGSYARKEANDQSDCDYFIIAPEVVAISKLREDLQKIIVSKMGKAPSVGGSFSEVEPHGTFGGEIGGQADSNDLITRRILFLTEGACVFGDKIFQEERKRILGRYLTPKITDHQLALFFLNDVIRFWRTMCVDFEHKTGAGGKAWGIRNIKLVFSRKMLYFGGVLLAAETWQKTYTAKIETVEHLMSLTPIERVVEICGSAADKVLKEYDFFLGELSKAEVRQALEKGSREEVRDTELFKSLKNRGHHFSLQLMGLLKQTYPEGHAIHRALVM